MFNLRGSHSEATPFVVEWVQALYVRWLNLLQFLLFYNITLRNDDIGFILKFSMLKLWTLLAHILRWCSNCIMLNGILIANLLVAICHVRHAREKDAYFLAREDWWAALPNLRNNGAGFIFLLSILKLWTIRAHIFLVCLSTFWIFLGWMLKGLNLETVQGWHMLCAISIPLLQLVC